MSTKKKSKHRGPPPPKVNRNLGVPRPKPVEWRNPGYYIQHAREYPLLGCWVMKGWQNVGITPVIVARKQDEEKVIFGSFLVDTYLLGIKDAMSNGDFSMKRFMANLPDLCSGEPEPCDVDFAHELIYGSIEYARKYGFEPHSDYKQASIVLDPPEAHPRRHHLKFGKDGKPFFISGPYDNVDAVYKKLLRTAGEGNFDFLLMGPEEDL